MKPRSRRAPPAPELGLAIGLIWGHLNAHQMEEAYQLACGCAAVWPDDQRLALMAAYAAVELAAPLEEYMVSALKNSGNTPWASVIWRRAYSPVDASEGQAHE